MSSIRLVLDPKYKLDMNRRDGDGRTVLHVAVTAKRNGLEMTRLLLEQPGIDLGAVDAWGLTPFLAAIQEGGADIVRFWVAERGASLPEPTMDVISGYGAIHLAVLDWDEQQALDKMRLLVVEHKVDALAWTASEDAETALSIAIGRGNLAATRFFISDYHADPGAVCGRHDSRPLHRAAEECHPHIIKFLIAKPSIDVNALDDQQKTPLHLLALFKDQPEFRDRMSQAIQLLLAAGASVKLKDSAGSTPQVAFGPYDLAKHRI
ncbi:Fc.00g081490.m01.CDS01 [Cosmosporella sp. VM-42]